MSNVNIPRLVENIKSGTTAYTPLVEVIVNAIQAIEDKGDKSGEITITIERSRQKELDNSTPAAIGFRISDNGIGFNESNRVEFDTLYSDHKVEKGGKGFGRFTALKYFTDFKVESVYAIKGGFEKCSFSMGKSNEIIVNFKTEPTQVTFTGSTVHLEKYKNGSFPDKGINVIARKLVEKILPYFITKNYSCPIIKIVEMDGSPPITLNNYINNELSENIKEIEITKKKFQIGKDSTNHEFTVRVFKFYCPTQQKSKVSLVAHKREVTATSIHNYIPEFIDEFYETTINNGSESDKNYIIKAYVFSKYLDDNVDYNRGGFTFYKEENTLADVSQNEIEFEASKIAAEAVGVDITARKEKKRKKVESYVTDEAPWHKSLLKKVDLSALTFDATNAEIETLLQAAKHRLEVEARQQAKAIIESDDKEAFSDDINEVLSKISETSKNDLIHYITTRKQVLGIFEKSLELNKNSEYETEGYVHDIIFPRRADSDNTPYEDHNLWILDERLNFTEYLTSDNSINGGVTDRADILCYDKPVLFRGDNVASNPITIFEFKRPQREDFVNPSSKDDPIAQIVRYVNNVRDGKYKTPKGRDISVADNTPFYGYVICDITKKVEKWLKEEKDYKPLPDNMGWFKPHSNINLYVEVISWDKLLKDANMRNKIFFHKLGI